MDVLQLDVSGRPQAWISPREAAVLYASDAIAWTLGDTFQAYAFFATCLGNLKAAGELPLWLPHAAWAEAGAGVSCCRPCSRASARSG